MGGKLDQSLLSNTLTPILCLNMWEHAYISDYGLDRRAYIMNFWKCVAWEQLYFTSARKLERYDMLYKPTLRLRNQY